MKDRKTNQLIAFLTGFAFLIAGCANTIPSRSKNAVPIRSEPIYPVRVAFSTLIDERPGAERDSPKRVSWPKGRGRVDYYGKLTDEGLTQAIADYLNATRLFTEVKKVDLVMNDQALKAQNFDLVLRGRIEEFGTSYSVPMLVLGFALVPNPLFFILPGITLVPIALWPKHITFDAVLTDLKLVDLRTSQELWQSKIEFHEGVKKMTVHIMPKWYLGEMVEKISKRLADKLWEAQLKI